MGSIKKFLFRIFISYCFTGLKRGEFLFYLTDVMGLSDYLDVLCDFSHGGYRIVGDIICDLDDMHRNKGIKTNITKQKGDSADLQTMLSGIERADEYKAHIIRNCINVICPPSRRGALDFDEVVKCAVALGSLMKNFRPWLPTPPVSSREI